MEHPVAAQVGWLTGTAMPIAVAPPARSGEGREGAFQNSRETSTLSMPPAGDGTSSPCRKRRTTGGLAESCSGIDAGPAARQERSIRCGG